MEKTNLLTGAALTTAAYSLLTDYELGALRILPMKAHLSLDAAQRVTLGAVPIAFQTMSGRMVSGDPLSSDTSRARQKQTMIGLLAISLIEGLIVLGSQTKAPSKNIVTRLLNRFS